MSVAHRILFGCCLAAAISFLNVATSFGQGYILNGVTYAAAKTDGVVDKIGPGYMEMLVGENRVMVLMSQAEIAKVFGQFKVDREIKFRLDIEGTADIDYLAKGQLVSF